MSDKSVFLVDISGKVYVYDDALYDALIRNCGDVGIRYLRPGHGLFSFIPKSLSRSSSTFKRVVKVLEIHLNYVLLCIMVCIRKPDVIHMQWLPLLDINGIEIVIFKIIKWLSPKLRLILTIHNVYPHRISDERRAVYYSRFRKVSLLFDDFIVHTNITKGDVISEFGLGSESIHVCCHGVFVPNGVKPVPTVRKDGKLHILQFGAQLYYKGTDLLVEAVSGLSEEYRSKVSTRIVGGISQKFFDELKTIDKYGDIEWKPFFLSDHDLYEEINSCDMVVLPYRSISQSGVLLLSIYFGKLIICSNLPSFVETMRGNDDCALDADLFFKSEDSESLRALLIKYIDRQVDENAIRGHIEDLRNLYTWDSAAKATIMLYNKE